MKSCRFAQLSFSFAALLRQNMTAMRLIAFKTTTSGSFKPLGGATIGFHFWHLFAPLLYS